MSMPLPVGGNVPGREIRQYQQRQGQEEEEEEEGGQQERQRPPRAKLRVPHARALGFFPSNLPCVDERRVLSCALIR